MSENRKSLESLRDVISHLFNNVDFCLSTNLQNEIILSATDIGKLDVALSPNIGKQFESEGIKRLELRLKLSSDKAQSIYEDVRHARQNNVVMVVDDDEYTRVLIRQSFSKIAECVEIGDTANLVDTYKRVNPNIIFLDNYMPGKKGTEVLKELFTIDPNAFVIMMSGDSSPNIIAFVIDNGVKGFIVKPFSKVKLLEFINKCPTFKIPKQQ